jgi:restriction endonuclease S subunit
MIHRYLNIPIAVPPIELQQQFVDEVNKLQNEAIALRKEANLKLEQAKYSISSVVLKK